MSGKVLGDYNTLRESVDDALNYESEDQRYMTLSTGVHGDGPEYGHGVSFATTLGRARSDADWAGAYGRRSIVVDLESMVFMPWDKLPVVYDSESED
ncbi:hypothetical protein ACFW2V_13440 [Streptomyces sp. NPDC058947]|uniref:hypothetical protein n=1 Tax=Streptomyces sp. NPDC058947 TaxID=3346675 RepID=UPI00369207E8